MDKGKIFVVVLVALLLIAAIAVAWSVLNLSRPAPSGHGGSIGFSLKSLNGSVPLWSTQYADDGNFSGFVRVQPSADCLLMAMVDYRVVPFYFDGSYNTTHYLNGSPYGDYPGVFSVTNLSEGFHDVILLGIVSPYNFTTDAWGISYGLATTGTLRFNVIVGNATRPSVTLENHSMAANTVYSTNSGFSSVLSAKPFDNRVLSREVLKPGAIFDYYVNVGHGQINGEIRNTSLAIVPMLDYRQIPLRYNETGDVYYGYIDRSENCSVHMSLKAPETPGPHRLVVIVVKDPYADLEVAPGITNTGITQSIMFEPLDFTVKP